jgi:hypothetical protein
VAPRKREFEKLNREHWHMFQALLPEGKADIIEALEDLKQAVQAGDDKEGIVRTIDELRGALAGQRGFPDLT